VTGADLANGQDYMALTIKHGGVTVEWKILEPGEEPLLAAYHLSGMSVVEAMKRLAEQVCIPASLLGPELDFRSHRHYQDVERFYSIRPAT
jgi:hypothetical protein